MIEAEIASRRNVLRGGLAAACSLLIPTALLGCKAKENETATSDASNEAPIAAPNESSAPAAAGKVTKDSVQYQVQPKGDQKCSDCMNYIAETSTCKVVDGSISPDGWCSLWSKKA